MITVCALKTLYNCLFTACYPNCRHADTVWRICALYWQAPTLAYLTTSASSPVTVVVVVHNESSDLPFIYPTTPKSMVCYPQIATRGYLYDAWKMVLSLMLWLVRSTCAYSLSDIYRPLILSHIALLTPGKRTMKRLHSNESKRTFPSGREKNEQEEHVVRQLIEVV